MLINQVNNNHTSSQAIEVAVNPQTAALGDEVVVAQEMSKPNQDLPNVFSLQAKSARAKKSSKKPKPVEESYSKKQEKAVREYLLGECQYIASVAAQESLNRTGGAVGSGMKHAIQREVTNYLLSVGSPIALQILDEYKAQWKKGI